MRGTAPVFVGVVSFLVVMIFPSRLSVLLVAGVPLFVFWMSAVIELLRTGPGEQAVWWAATLAIVVVLGPLGAFIYHVADPQFARSEHPLHA